MTPIASIKKRDGRIVPFDQSKITEAIWRSAQSVGGKDKKQAENITHQVITVLEVFYKDDSQLPTVEQIQDLVEKILIENGHAKTAKSYILYRQKQKDIRKEKAQILGSEQETIFSIPVIKILERNFLQKDKKGFIKETPEQLFQRVASATKNSDIQEIIYKMMINGEFLPGKIILKNAGIKNIKHKESINITLNNNIESIFESLKKTAIHKKNGNDININFSDLSPRGDVFLSASNIASGPVAFIEIFDSAMRTIKKQGICTATLDISHPDILEFLNYSKKDTSSFKLAIKINQEFIAAVKAKEMYNLKDPNNNEITNSLNAKNVMDLIVSKIWNKNEPSIIFSEITANSSPLRGYINVSKFTTNENQIDWNNLGKTIQNSVKFLEGINNNTENNILISVIGFADLLYNLKIQYDSNEAINTADELMGFIQKEAHSASNLCKTSISSENIISKIAETSPGVEPKQDIVYAFNIEEKWHIKIQSAFQKHIDINSPFSITFPPSTTLENIKNICINSHEAGNCGITIKRNKVKKKSPLSYSEIISSENIERSHKSLDNQESLPFNHTEESESIKPRMGAQEVLPPPINISG